MEDTASTMGPTPAKTWARARLLMRRAVLARVGQNLTQDPEAELNRIEAALRRIDAGRYGICDGCGAGIGAQVLFGNPASVLCAGCATRSDRHHGVAR